MSVRNMIIGVAAIVGGAVLFRFADVDDSPGGQMIGVVVAVFGVYWLVSRGRVAGSAGPKS